jgi:hypothetical protein
MEAFIVKSILFDFTAKLDKLLALSDRERSLAVAEAMASMLSLCRPELESPVVVALPTAKVHLASQERFRRDGFTETLSLHTLSDEDAARAFLLDNIGAFVRAGQSAALALVFSSALTRGEEGILEDMDDSRTTLVAQHGYCSQEMVNLLVTGRAVSNVFDYTVTLPSDSGDEPATVLKGISRPSSVGLLSLFEHYGSCAVGEHLKTPSLPIWLVCAESHFSLLFGAAEGLERASAADRHPIDLHYYDGLSRPEELIRLTVDCSVSATSVVTAHRQGLAAPLEQCIRTKWHDARVNWNGSEKIL